MFNRSCFVPCRINNNESVHHSVIFMTKQMTVIHICINAVGEVVKFCNNFHCFIRMYKCNIFPSGFICRRRIPISTYYVELNIMYMHGMCEAGSIYKFPYFGCAEHNSIVNDIHVEQFSINGKRIAGISGIK